MLLPALLALSTQAAAICLTDQRPHLCLRAADALASCSGALANDPSSVELVLALCEAQVRADDLASASATVSRGLDQCARRGCKTLELALSNVEERRLAAERKDPAEARRTADVQRSYCLGPISNERSIKACERLLVSEPRNGDLYVALADKLLKGSQPVYALSYLNRAQRLVSADTRIADQASRARSLRQSLARTCVDGGSLSQCNAALLSGSADELEIQRRRAQLLFRAGQSEQGLRALALAWALAPGNPVTARSIIESPSSTFRTAPLSAQQMLADAHLALDQTDEALDVLLASQTRFPSNQELADRIATLTQNATPQGSEAPASRAPTISRAAPTPPATLPEGDNGEPPVALETPAAPAVPADATARTAPAYANALRPDGNSY